MANFEYSDPKEPTFWQNGNHGPGLWKLIVLTPYEYSALREATTVLAQSTSGDISTCSAKKAEYSGTHVSANSVNENIHSGFWDSLDTEHIQKAQSYKCTIL